MNDTTTKVQNHIKKNRIAYMLAAKFTVAAGLGIAMRVALAKALEDAIVEGAAIQNEE